MLVSSFENYHFDSNAISHNYYTCWIGVYFIYILYIVIKLKSFNLLEKEVAIFLVATEKRVRLRFILSVIENIFPGNFATGKKLINSFDERILLKISLKFNEGQLTTQLKEESVFIDFSLKKEKIFQSFK